MRGFLIGAAVPVLLAAGASTALAAGGGVGFGGQVTRGGGPGLSPLAAETVSFAEEAGLRLVVSNTAGRQRRFRLVVYDKAFRPVAAQVFPADASLAAGASRQFTVIVPFEGAVRRDLTICVERSGHRGVCGSYLVRRERLD
ncbi:MAG: hypothetical protein R3D45_06140 [Rhizobiaceae bacterium]